MDLKNHPGEDFFQRMTRLIGLEAEAEKEEILKSLGKATSSQAESTGNSLTNLTIREEGIGMSGRILLTLGKRNQKLSLPWTRLRSGSPVILSADKANDLIGSEKGLRGVVSRLRKDDIQIVANGWPEIFENHQALRLDRSTDEVTRRRERQALDRAHAANNSRLAELREVLLGNQTPSFQKTNEAILFLDPDLNNSQKQAVRFALSAEDIGVIHGPPGTGKTTTLVELIRQIIRKDQSVLAVAPSNLAVDNMLERVLEMGEKAIRLGHPARVSANLREHTLDFLVENNPEVRLAHKMISDAHRLQGKASKYTRAKPEPGMRQALRIEAKDMLKEASKIEEQAIRHVLGSAKIVCATLTGLDEDILRGRSFDWCILDEASQCTEPDAWIPLQFANRLILAGDHFQLPPTILSQEALSEGFNITLMERLLTDFPKDIARLLTVQYRMHKDIMTFSSQVFYQGKLLADPSVENALLQSLPGVIQNDLTNCPIHFIDTAGGSYDEELDLNTDSRLNKREADLVVKKVNSLINSGLSSQNIGVITPYSAQVRLLRDSIMDPDIEIDSVDGFQGREKEAVIVSLVRSNRDGEIGFLEDIRRMNVALTRARRKIIVIGDSATISTNPFYEQMLAYFESIGAYHSIWEDH